MGDKYGFTITVIMQKELPDIVVSGDVNVKFDETVTMGCNLTSYGDGPNTNSLEKFIWIKDGIEVAEMEIKKDKKKQSSGNLKVVVRTPSDAGVYTCKLICLLRDQRRYDVIGNITIEVKPRF